MEKTRKYKHIFDFFNEDGKWVGGAEPISDSLVKPTGIHGTYSTPVYIIYVGWCYEDEDVISGGYYPDAVNYNKETKQLTPIYKVTALPDGTTYRTAVGSKEFYHNMTLERSYEILGRELPEKYLQHKKKKEEEFQEEYQKVLNDGTYFKENYYDVIKKQQRSW